jgi:uncharacterized protein YceK
MTLTNIIKKLALMLAVMILCSGCFAKSDAAKESLRSVGQSAGELNQDSQNSKKSSEQIRNYESSEKLKEYKW